MTEVTYRPTTLYRLFAADGALLYVGIACNPGRRFEQHAQSKPWWPKVATIRLEHHRHRPDALDAERVTIWAERPRFNVAHNNGALAAAVAVTSVPCPACGEAAVYVRRFDEFRHLDGSDSAHCHWLMLTGRAALTWEPPDWWWRAFPKEPVAPCRVCGEPAALVPLARRQMHWWMPRADAECWATAVPA